MRAKIRVWLRRGTLLGTSTLALYHGCAGSGLKGPKAENHPKGDGRRPSEQGEGIAGYLADPSGVLFETTGPQWIITIPDGNLRSRQGTTTEKVLVCIQTVFGTTVESLRQSKGRIIAGPEIQTLTQKTANEAGGIQIRISPPTVTQDSFLALNVSSLCSVGGLVVEEDGLVTSVFGPQIRGSNATSVSTSTETRGTPSCSGLVGGTWILVPGDKVYGTSDFCVMKYFASNQVSAPLAQTGMTAWTNISQRTAISECESLGTGYHLITNPEWMTIATNAAGQASNWSQGTVGGGLLARGHSDNTPPLYCGADPNDLNAYVEGSCVGGTLASTGDTFEQRRTHYLSNGSVIWDFAGNYWQWVDYNNGTNIPNSGAGAFLQYPAVVGTATTPKSHLVPERSSHSFWNDSWDATQSIGNYFPGTNGAGQGALARGAGKNIGVDGGLFAVRLNYGASDATQENITFRCAYTP